MKKSVTFVSAFLGGMHGTAQSARDYLRALLASRFRVSALCPAKENFGTIIGDTRLTEPCWLEDVLSSSKFRFRDSYSLNYWLVKYHDLRASLNMCFRTYGGLVIVNGWASIPYWEKRKSFLRGDTGIIIRESPRHFLADKEEITAARMVATFMRFDFLIFVSEIGRREWLQFPELAGKESFLVRNCCEEDLAVSFLRQSKDEVRRNLGLDLKEFVILCPGSIEHRKGHDLLFQVLPKLIAVIPNLRVLFVGNPRDAWGREFIARVEHSDISAYVSFKHNVHGLFEYMRAADLLVFPSRAEALPRTILEAMVMQLPVVASGVDGIPELIIDHQTGLLFPSEDNVKMFSFICEMYADMDAARIMAMNGEIRYWNTFSRMHQFSAVAASLDELHKV